MTLYFMLHDAARFHGQLRPALTAAWQQRSFEPCRALGPDLTTAVLNFTERYRVRREELLLSQVQDGLAFDRHSWRQLAGELLLCGAAEVPEVPTALETVTLLLAPEAGVTRECFAPIQQAHLGTRDLVLGGYYRPEAAGYNDVADVARLEAYLANCLSGPWTLADLRPRRPEVDDSELSEELEHARACLHALRELYSAASGQNQVVVCEAIDCPVTR